MDHVQPRNQTLPKMPLKIFAKNLLNICPVLNTLDAFEAYHKFNKYKATIPVRGAIILNEKMTKVLMVKGCGPKPSWGFPRGKIQKDEPDYKCAIREVKEEIGFDISPHLNLDETLEATFSGTL